LQDTKGTFKLSSMAKGIEETAVLGLVSPPQGAAVISAYVNLGLASYNIC
jgi:xyloglucan-specific exo-beta-1,4-glucanase